MTVLTAHLERLQRSLEAGDAEGASAEVALMLELVANAEPLPAGPALEQLRTLWSACDREAARLHGELREALEEQNTSARALHAYGRTERAGA